MKLRFILTSRTVQAIKDGAGIGASVYAYAFCGGGFAFGPNLTGLKSI